MYAEIMSKHREISYWFCFNLWQNCFWINKIRIIQRALAIAMFQVQNIELHNKDDLFGEMACDEVYIVFKFPNCICNSESTTCAQKRSLQKVRTACQESGRKSKKGKNRNVFPQIFLLEWALLQQWSSTKTISFCISGKQISRFVWNRRWVRSTASEIVAWASGWYIPSRLTSLCFCRFVL